MIRYSLLILLFLSSASAQDTITAPSGERIVKSNWAKIPSWLIFPLEQYEKDIASGFARDLAFRRFNGLPSDEKNNLFLAVTTNGNDFDVVQEIQKLGGHARIDAQKNVSCSVAPELIRKIAALKDVIRVDTIGRPSKRTK